MEESNQGAQSSFPRERKHRRFSLQYPVRVTVHEAESVIEFEALSSNISVGGLLFEASSPIPRHTPVSFVVTVQMAQVVRPLQFAGEGKVVRVEPKATPPAFAIAVECQQPITQIGAPIAG